MIDLHCHSYHSDGLLSPAELVQKALINNLQCLALTDHDTISGINELKDAASGTNLHIINGVELSTRWKKHDIHILGYQFHPNNSMNDILNRQIQNRMDRAIQIGEALEKLGLENAYDKACTLAGHKQIARPHFAKILVQEGLCKDVQSAFKKFLGRGKPAYVPTPWISIEDAASCINQSGGCAVIAHPLKYNLTRTKLYELIEEFKEAGGTGIEVVSGESSEKETMEMAGISIKFKLLASSGSDYHGDGISRVGLGQQRPLPVHCSPIWLDWKIEQGTL